MYKLVPEHINEIHNFERGKENKLFSLGVGQFHLITSWLDEMYIKNYVINDDLTINAYDYVDLQNRNLTKFPDYIQFNDIDGSFDCSHNELISLKGCPRTLRANFWCDHNKLTSLEGSPKHVGGLFGCENNTKQFTKEDVLKYCKVVNEGNIYV